MSLLLMPSFFVSIAALLSANEVVSASPEYFTVTARTGEGDGIGNRWSVVSEWQVSSQQFRGDIPDHRLPITFLIRRVRPPAIRGHREGAGFDLEPALLQEEPPQGAQVVQDAFAPHQVIFEALQVVD